jgi:cytochrome c1
MPDDLVQKMSKQEVRDLVEFLAGLKEEWKK